MSVGLVHSQLYCPARPTSETVDMTKLRSVLVGIFRQSETSAAEQFVVDTLGGVQRQWSEDVVEMLEAYRAELCKRQSDGLASGLRWTVVAVVGIVLLNTVAANIPRVAVGIIQATVLATALALPSAFGQALAAWRSRQYVDTCLGTARWVLANPPHHTVAANQPPSAEGAGQGERKEAACG